MKIKTKKEKTKIFWSLKNYNLEDTEILAKLSVPR